MQYNLPPSIIRTCQTCTKLFFICSLIILTLGVKLLRRPHFAKGRQILQSSDNKVNLNQMFKKTAIEYI